MTMAPAGSRSHAALSKGHGRLHKRGSSASSITSPTALSPLPDSHAFTFNRSTTPKVTYEEPWNEPPARLMSTNAPSVKIKPYLRKLSSHNSNSLDLSRPAAENECLAGLGITDEYSHSAADVNFTSMSSSRGRHNRSTSNNSHCSQYSTASSLRPTAQPLPPIYQTTPRSFTPPISRSTPASILCSEQEGEPAFTDDSHRQHHGHTVDPARRSGSISSSNPGVTSPLRINTNSSSTKLGGSYSQSSASLTSPLGQVSRSRSDNIKTTDPTSPSARTSIDRAFSFMRGGRDSPIDPASRAANIRAARQAFMEKEEARERKHDKELNKQAERDSRKQFKQEERAMRKSESHDRVINYPYTQSSRSRSFSDSQNEKSTFGRPSFSSRPSYSGRPSIGGRQPSDKRRSTLGTVPAMSATYDPEKQVSATRAAKGRWLRFVTWFKTRILRITNRVQTGHA